MNKLNPQTEASIEFFQGIKPKLTIRNILKQKLDDICTWLDLNDTDTKVLIKETASNNTFSIYYKIFESRTGHSTWKRFYHKEHYLQNIPPRQSPHHKIRSLKNPRNY